MKTYISVFLLFIFNISFSYGLSCMYVTPFEELYSKSDIAFVGTVTDVFHVPEGSATEYSFQGGKMYRSEDEDIRGDTGEYKFTFDLIENHNNLGIDDGIVLTKVARGISSGSSCLGMEVGKTYMVLTDGSTIKGGGCSVCPYKLVEDFTVPGTLVSCERGYSGEVCGTDRVTYKDICDLEAEGAEKAYDGNCIISDISKGLVSAPNFCSSRYDGCNNCKVEKGELVSCTNRLCYHKEKSGCNEFEFILLEPEHEGVIITSVSNRATTATSESRENISKKVTSKIDSINSLLARSTFVQGSKELRSYQLALEVLWMVDSLL